MDVTIVDVFREKFEFDKLYDAIRESHTKWKTDKVIIEDRSSGSNLANVLPNVGVPIERVKATVSKRARAVQAIGGNVASTQGWFQMGRVNILANQPWTNSLVEELLSFDGTGVSDQVDALVHLVNYAISITNRGEVPLVKEPETKVEPLSPVTNFLPATDNISKAEYIRNTFGSARVCGTCSHFSENHCSLRKIACHMFYSCPDYSGVEIY
jgi:predicted phage terminase large subunit-like protein